MYTVNSIDLHDHGCDVYRKGSCGKFFFFIGIIFGLFAYDIQVKFRTKTYEIMSSLLHIWLVHSYS